MTGGNKKRETTESHRRWDIIEGWKEEKRYGDRWAVEGAYSCIKRIFGEYVSAKKFVNMAKEMATKVSLYNLFMQMNPREGG